MTTRALISNEIPLTIECMIENALLHSILDTIFEKNYDHGELFKMTVDLTFYVDC
jgi:hypothetical protein